jgi:hypothetical protein
MSAHSNTGSDANMGANSDINAGANSGVNSNMGSGANSGVNANTSVNADGDAKADAAGTVARQRRPAYKAWWLWTSVGAVVAAGAVTGIVIATQHTSPQFAPNLPESGPHAHALVTLSF